MNYLTVELPSTKEDWALFDGRMLDDKVGELNVAQRRIEGSIAQRGSRRSHATEPT